MNWFKEVLFELKMQTLHLQNIRINSDVNKEFMKELFKEQVNTTAKLMSIDGWLKNIHHDLKERMSTEDLPLVKETDHEKYKKEQQALSLTRAIENLTKELKYARIKEENKDIGK